MTRPKVSAKRVGTLITFRRVIPKIESRSLTIDIWAPPQKAHDVRQWFLQLLGMIWWDTSETESYVITSRDVDQFMRLLATHRDLWVAEQKARDEELSA